MTARQDKDFGVRRSLLCCAAAILIALTCASTAAASGAIIRTDGSRISWVGRWHVTAWNSKSMPAARRALGSPSQTFGVSNGCGVGVWSRLGLRISFCDFWYRDWMNSGTACSFKVTGGNGRSHWKTAKGLRVGDSLGQLKRLYPGVRRHGSLSWWLSSRYSPLGDYHYPPVAAHVRSGKIESLIFSSSCDS